jgi:ribosomal protein L13E
MSASSKKQAKPKKAPAKSKIKPNVAKAKKVEKAAREEEKPKRAAPKPKKVVERKQAPPKAAAKTRPVKMGPPPTAVVAARHIDSLHEREARGFSFGELSAAGIPINMAKEGDLSVDIRRRSVVEQNVATLKGWFKHPGRVEASGATESQIPVAPAIKKK